MSGDRELGGKHPLSVRIPVMWPLEYSSPIVVKQEGGLQFKYMIFGSGEGNERVTSTSE